VERAGHIDHHVRDPEVRAHATGERDLLLAAARTTGDLGQAEAHGHAEDVAALLHEERCGHR
jgi:hypothetical protein